MRDQVKEDTAELADMLSKEAKEAKQLQKAAMTAKQLEDKFETQVSTYVKKQKANYNATLCSGNVKDFKKNPTTEKYILSDYALVASKTVWANKTQHKEVRICLMIVYRKCTH